MIITVLLACLPVVFTNDDLTWSEEAVVRNGRLPVVRFRACIQDDYLLVKATHSEGWHTYAMDNELRAAAALAGKTSLGIEQGLEIRVESGLRLGEQWLQTKPTDLSKPELRWFTYGFDRTALFACRVKDVTSDPVILRIEGQACSGETCCLVNIPLKLPAVLRSINELQQSSAVKSKKMLVDLVPVRTQPAQAIRPEPKSNEPKNVFGNVQPSKS